ncbi:MAG: type II toxin-antitoxin system HicB family antitoxin [Halobacteriales archaeon]|nr:type II toxin-antitoxin system HicB family antitoxin [Halobacteriales archaeon]
MRFSVVLSPRQEGGFSAECVEVPGASAAGKDADAALCNVADAIARIVEARRGQAQRSPGRLETIEVEVESPPRLGPVLEHPLPAGRSTLAAPAILPTFRTRWWR